MKQPTELIVGLTNLCNTNCAFCYVRKYRKEHQERLYADSNAIIGLCEEFKQSVKVVEFSGIGEPLLFPDFDDLVADVHDLLPHAQLQLVTNGELVTKHYSLVDFSQISISLNAATSETHKLIMPNLSFDHIVNTIDMLTSIKGKRPQVLVTFVANKYNYQEMDRFIGLCLKLGVDRVSIRSVDPQLDSMIYSGLKTDKPTVKPMLDSLRKEYCGLKNRLLSKVSHLAVIEIAPDAMFWPNEYHWVDVLEVRCLNAETVFGVYNVSGEVKPCCYIGEIFGNIYKHKPQDIWNKCVEFAERIKLIPPLVCRSCSNYWSKTIVS